MSIFTALLRNSVLMAGLLGLLQSAAGTSQAANESDVASATKRVQNGTFTLHDLSVLRATHTNVARSELRHAFTTAQDQPTKEMVASALVAGGDQDPTYWDYLEGEGRKVVGSDAPAPSDFDTNGRMSSQLSPAYSAWAKAHRMDEEQAIEQNWENLGTVQIIVDTGDKRAIPILRQGLVSPNLMVADLSAEGLAKLGDQNSEPLIEELCGRVPASVASDIAIHSLLIFQSTAAQHAAQRYIPAHLLIRLQRERAGQPSQH